MNYSPKGCSEQFFPQALWALGLGESQQGRPGGGGGGAEHVVYVCTHVGLNI